jgi:hypothetical protein
MNLHERLKEQIFGKIFCKITYNDELYVNIESCGDVNYSLTIPNVTEKIINGWSTEYAAYEIVNAFKKHVIKIAMKKYFR